jgi:peptidoglycan/LPS O-acetylase OafA/YrhL
MVHVPIMYLGWIYMIRSYPTMMAIFPPPPQPINAQEGLIACAAAVTLTLLVASVTYKHVEVPARNYLNKRFKPRELVAVKVVNEPR